MTQMLKIVNNDSNITIVTVLNAVKENILKMSEMRKSQHKNRNHRKEPEIFFFFFGCPCGIQKFSGQRLNPCHNGDNTRSLTCQATGEL